MWKRIKGVIRRNLFSIISISLAAILLLIFFFATDGVNSLANIIPSLRIEWLILTIACMALYWVFEAVTLHIFTLNIYKRWRFKNSFSTASVGLLYSALTPSSTGGQPMEILQMKKLGMDTGAATSIVVLKTFIYQVVLVIYSLVLIVWQLGFFQRNISNFSFIVIIGLLLNSAFILLLILFTLNRTLTRKILNFLVKVGAKIRIVKHPEKTLESVENQLELFHKNTRLNKNTAIVLFKTFLTSFLQFTFYFFIPYCIYRSFGLEGAPVIQMLAAQSFVMMVSAFVPLPGGSGGAEGSFVMFFGMFFTAEAIMPAVLIWRIVTYYFIILFGCILMYVGSKKEKPMLLDDKA